MPDLAAERRTYADDLGLTQEEADEKLWAIALAVVGSPKSVDQQLVQAFDNGVRVSARLQAAFARRLAGVMDDAEPLPAATPARVLPNGEKLKLVSIN